MANLKMDGKYRYDVRQFFKKTQDTQEKQNTLANFFEEISPSLQKKVRSEIFTESIQGNEILKAVTELQEEDLARRLE